MYRAPAVICACALWIAVGHCNTLILQPFSFIPEPGNSYAWVIPPQLQLQQESPLDAQNPNQSPPPLPRGCGHPPFIRRHSQEQLRLPNEFLIAPSDPQRPSPPLFLQLNPVNCDGADCTHHRAAATQQQTNPAGVPAIPEGGERGAPGQPVNWPSNHGSGVGLLFFVPESEQLIRQQLALHRTQFPFDVSMNCGDSGAGCSGAGAKPATAATTFNGEPAENVNYASLPLVKNVNNSGQQGRGWMNIGELLAQQQQQQHQRQLSMLPS